MSTSDLYNFAWRKLAANQKRMIARNPDLVIAETFPRGSANSTLIVVTRAEADGMATRILPRGGTIMIHHTEGTVTMTPEPAQ